MSLLLIDGATVRAQLDYADCIAEVRDAMIALSTGQARQPLRSVLDLGDGNAFGLMPGTLDAGDGVFGAKLISVFPRNFERGLPSHQGLVALFDPRSGAAVAIIDAAALTAVRTAAASAVATNALACADATALGLLGYGEQAAAHRQAICAVRGIREVRVWGRSPQRLAAFINRQREQIGPDAPEFIGCADVAAVVASSDIVCCVTAASEPVLHGARLRPGQHVNLVGSGRAGPAEADSEVVRRSRFFADHRESVLRQGAEFLVARAAGIVDDDHLLGEIGEVLAGRIGGRLDRSDITVYKSLGSIVQDLAAARLLYRRARERGFGTMLEF